MLEQNYALIKSEYLASQEPTEEMVDENQFSVEFKGSAKIIENSSINPEIYQNNREHKINKINSKNIKLKEKFSRNLKDSERRYLLSSNIEIASNERSTQNRIDGTLREKLNKHPQRIVVSINSNANSYKNQSDLLEASKPEIQTTNQRQIAINNKSSIVKNKGMSHWEQQKDREKRSYHKLTDNLHSRQTQSEKKKEKAPHLKSYKGSGQNKGQSRISNGSNGSGSNYAQNDNIFANPQIFKQQSHHSLEKSRRRQYVEELPGKNRTSNDKIQEKLLHLPLLNSIGHSNAGTHKRTHHKKVLKDLGGHDPTNCEPSIDALQINRQQQMVSRNMENGLKEKHTKKHKKGLNSNVLHPKEMHHIQASPSPSSIHLSKSSNSKVVKISVQRLKQLKPEQIRLKFQQRVKEGQQNRAKEMAIQTFKKDEQEEHRNGLQQFDIVDLDNLELANVAVNRW